MIELFVGALLALAAVTLGLRITSVLVPGWQPLVRMAIALIIGTACVMMTLRISDRYQVHDLGLGLLVSLSPVGIYDFLKWWHRFRRG